MVPRVPGSFSIGRLAAVTRTRVGPESLTAKAFSSRRSSRIGGSASLMLPLKGSVNPAPPSCGGPSVLRGPLPGQPLPSALSPPLLLGGLPRELPWDSYACSQSLSLCCSFPSALKAPQTLIKSSCTPSGLSQSSGKNQPTLGCCSSTGCCPSSLHHPEDRTQSKETALKLPWA